MSELKRPSPVSGGDIDFPVYGYRARVSVYDAKDWPRFLKAVGEREGCLMHGDRNFGFHLPVNADSRSRVYLASVVALRATSGHYSDPYYPMIAHHIAWAHGRVNEIAIGAMKDLVNIRNVGLKRDNPDHVAATEREFQQRATGPQQSYPKIYNKVYNYVPSVEDLIKAAKPLVTRYHIDTMDNAIHGFKRMHGKEPVKASCSPEFITGLFGEIRARYHFIDDAVASGPAKYCGVEIVLRPADQREDVVMS